MRHLAANMWYQQKKKGVVGKLKGLRKVHTEDRFKELLKDLIKGLNDEAKEWLKGEMDDKEKWCKTFDTGGVRCGLMTTNYLESLNNVFKGVRSRPISGIIEYSFSKCNKYFLKRRELAREDLNKGNRRGKIANDCITKVEPRSVHQEAEVRPLSLPHSLDPLYDMINI